MFSWLRMRGGHVWCNRHKTWWKLCPCPGEASGRFTITKDIIRAITPDRNAFKDAEA